MANLLKNLAYAGLTGLAVASSSFGGLEGKVSGAQPQNTSVNSQVNPDYIAYRRNPDYSFQGLLKTLQNAKVKVYDEQKLRKTFDALDLDGKSAFNLAYIDGASLLKTYDSEKTKAYDNFYEEQIKNRKTPFEDIGIDSKNINKYGSSASIFAFEIYYKALSSIEGSIK